MRFPSSMMVSLMLLAGTVAFTATAVGEYLSLEELLMRDQAREHARQAQLLIKQTGTLLLDLETGQRGFIITGESSFLEPYDRARLEFEDTYTALKEHLKGDGPVPESFVRLDELAHKRIAQVERNVERRWAIGEAVLKDLPSFMAGKRLMDEIRAELSRLEEAQDQNILRANLGTQAIQERTRLLAIILPAVGCCLIVGAAMALHSERRRRDRAEAALYGANERLESEVGKRTAQLLTALRRIRGFASELDNTVEAERKQLAREVHDQIGQIGTATKMVVLGLRRQLGSSHEEAMKELLALADENINTARSISASLRPPLLDDFGLAAALEHYAKSLSRRSEIIVDVDVHGDTALTPSQANQLFRIAQEACTNVLRHADAKGLVLQGWPQSDTEYRLDISDDGKGPGSVRADAAGLRNMRERAEMAQGRFEFGPAPGRGTRVSVVLPLETADAETSL